MQLETSCGRGGLEPATENGEPLSQPGQPQPGARCGPPTGHRTAVLHLDHDVGAWPALAVLAAWLIAVVALSSSAFVLRDA